MIETKTKKNKGREILAYLLIVSFVMANFFAVQKQALAQEEGGIGDLTQEIEQRKKDIETLQKEIDAYEEQINQKQKEAKTLRNQLAILENQIAKVELDISATEKKIEETNLEIQTLNLQINQKEEEIVGQKNKISEYIRLIHQNDQVSYLEVLMLNNNFSEFFDYMKYIEEIHGKLNEMLNKLKADKKEMEIQKSNLEEKKQQEETLKDQLSQQKSELEERSTGREIVLVQTRLTERQYQNYLYQLQLEQQQINSDIITLEKRVREELEKKNKEEIFNEFGPAALGWPVSPDRGITAYFHDPDYPFRYIFEHPAIDIRAYQGTSIKAAENGYVAKVKFNGSTSYAYIMLIHNDGLSTVYGHVSRVDVEEDQFVTKGQIIGASGGMPGTPGAGNLSTGPHLHFEVRLNGIPVNPLEYLP